MLLYTCIIAGLAYAIWIIYISTAFKSDAKPTEVSTLKFISVVVPFRNESGNIINLLNALLKQTFPKDDFEVLLINDHSEDDSTSVISRFLIDNKANNFHLINSVSKGKKGALEEGIKHSRGGIIITTDADCVMSCKWIQVLHDAYIKSRTSMLAAPVLIDGNNSFIQVFQQVDYMAMQICGLGSMKRQLPLLCSGANLIFGKEDFYAVDGYTGNQDLASGDDTFLMLKLAKRNGCIALIDNDAIVTAKGMPDFKSVINQRVRWGSKVKYYKNTYITVAGLTVMIVNLLFVVSVVALIGGSYYPFLSMLFFKVLPDIVVLMMGYRFFNIRYTISVFLMLVVHPFLQLFISLLSLRGRYEWRGRVYRS